MAANLVQGDHFSKFLISKFLKGLTYSALVALVWLFPCMNVHMSSQLAFLIRFIIALIAIVDFFFNIVFLALMIAFVEKAITTSYPFNFPIIIGMFVAFMLPNFLAIIGF